jgi:hypothetical protein
MLGVPLSLTAQQAVFSIFLSSSKELPQLKVAGHPGVIPFPALQPFPVFQHPLRHPCSGMYTFLSLPLPLSQLSPDHFMVAAEWWWHLKRLCKHRQLLGSIF